MGTRILLRQDNEAIWQSLDTVLDNGELGYSNDTGRFKIGDGVATWLELPFLNRQYSAVSAPLVPLINAARVAAHGLDTPPLGVDVWAEVTTAFAGYAIGDKIYTFAANWPTVSTDNNNMTLVFLASLPSVKSKAGGTTGNVSIGTNVRLYMRAYR